MKKIEEIRKEIDLIDDRIFCLLKQRLKLVISTLNAREQTEDLGREEEILEKIASLAGSDYEDRYIGNIYMSIFSEGKKIKEIIKKKNEEI